MPTETDVSILADEYRTIVSEASRTKDPDAVRQRLADLLTTTSEWKPQTASALLDLAEQYGTFVLRNALALAIALEIEDGSLGY